MYIVQIFNYIKQFTSIVFYEEILQWFIKFHFFGKNNLLFRRNILLPWSVVLCLDMQTKLCISIPALGVGELGKIPLLKQFPYPVPHPGALIYIKIGFSPHPIEIETLPLLVSWTILLTFSKLVISKR